MRKVPLKVERSKQGNKMALDTSYIPGTLLGTLHGFSYLILIAVLGGTCYCFLIT